MDKINGEVKAVLLRQLKAIQNFLELNNDMRTTDKVGDAFENLICELEELDG